jgi:orotate phosphoribosyltransferase
MEEQKMMSLLEGCLDAARVKASEEALASLKRSPTFVQSLLIMMSKGFSNEQALIMALSIYRKFLE